MRYSYFPGPEWNWFPEREKGSNRADEAEQDKSPKKVLVEMALVFGLSLGLVLMIDAIVLLAEFPLKAFHLG